jgi:hypothetical protein
MTDDPFGGELAARPLSEADEEQISFVKIGRVTPRATAWMDSMTTIHHLTQDWIILVCDYRGADTSVGATI